MQAIGVACADSTKHKMSSHRELRQQREIKWLRAEVLRLTERIAKLERWVEHLRCAHEAARLIAGRVFEEVDSE